MEKSQRKLLPGAAGETSGGGGIVSVFLIGFAITFASAAVFLVGFCIVSYWCADPMSVAVPLSYAALVIPGLIGGSYVGWRLGAPVLSGLILAVVYLAAIALASVIRGSRSSLPTLTVILLCAAVSAVSVIGAWIGARFSAARDRRARRRRISRR